MRLMAVFAFVAPVIGIAVIEGYPILIILAVLGVSVINAALSLPMGRDLVTVFYLGRVNQILLALTVFVLVALFRTPLSKLASKRGAIGPARRAHDGGEYETIHEQHIKGGHFTWMVWFSSAIIFTGRLASFQRSG